MSAVLGSTAWLNGQLVPVADATIPLMSNAVFRGTAVFDVMSVVDVAGVAHAVGMSPHVDRLFRSAEEMGLEIDATPNQLTGAIADVLAAVTPPAIVRIVIANAGPPAGRSSAQDIVTAVTAETAEQQGSAPLRLRQATAKIDRSVIPPHIKVAATYAAGLRAEHKATADGFDGIVNVSADGYVLEGVSASVGLIADGAVRFPPLSHVLDSISRRLIIDVARHGGIAVEEVLTPIDMVGNCDAAFIASTTRPIVPIESIDDQRFATDDSTLIGIADAVRRVLAGEHELSSTWLTAIEPDR